MRLIGYLFEGGWVMWPLLGCSLISAAIIIERLVNLRPGRFLPPDLTARVETLVEARSFARARELCARHPGVFTNIVRAALEAQPAGRDAVREAVEAAGRREVPRVGRYLTTLSSVVGVAPLLGLLGTVLGMIEIFRVASQGVRQASALSGGIAVALLTTAFGMIIAIPSLVMHNALSKRAEGIVLDIESRVIILTGRLFHADGSPVEDAGEAAETAPPRRSLGVKV
jgi:biopolymer transport protein ExbB